MGRRSWIAVVSVTALGAAAGGAYAFAGPIGHPAGAPPTTASTLPAPNPTITLPPDGPITPLDGSTAGSGTPAGRQQAAAAAAAVSYRLSGQCHAAGTAYTCQVSVLAPRGGETPLSTGAVVIDPDRARAPSCAGRGTVTGGVATVKWSCPLPRAAAAFAYYTLGPPGPGDAPLAVTSIPFG